MRPVIRLASPALPLLALLVGCQDTKVGVYNTPPTVTIVSPPDGTSIGAGESLEFYGLARDDQSDSPELAIVWASSIDGDLDSTPSDVDGSLYFATSALSPGDHTMTLTAIDEKGEATTASIGVHVGGAAVDGPTVTILSPAPSQVYTYADVINLIASVSDTEDAMEALAVEVIDVPDGTLWTGAPTTTGAVNVPLAPSPGSHSLTVTARDTDGNLNSATVAYSVEGDGRPGATIDDPSDGSTFSTTDVITFRGTVIDADTDIEDIGVSWTSDLVGEFSVAAPDSSGHTSIGTSLIAGVHTIRLTATDELAQTGSDTIVLTVYDSNDVDDDGDGWTENTGDCDDTNGGTYPGAEEQCDSVDNNCDGVVNETYWDTYEVNNTSPGADQGEIDAEVFGGDTRVLSGLTLSDPTDEDWFTWNADDEWYDNIDISVTASGLPASGDYVIELYDLRDGHVETSASGASSLTVYFSGSGDFTDDSEDEWAVRIYAATWPHDSCATTYTLTIHS